MRVCVCVWHASSPNRGEWTYILLLLLFWPSAAVLLYASRVLYVIMCAHELGWKKSGLHRVCSTVIYHRDDDLCGARMWHIIIYIPITPHTS